MAISTITFPLATFAARRLRVQPTAIGLIPPPFFSNAIKEAPKKKGQIESGVWPERIKLMMERNASIRAVPPEWADGLTMSLRLNLLQ